MRKKCHSYNDYMKGNNYFKKGVKMLSNSIKTGKSSPFSIYASSAKLSHFKHVQFFSQLSNVRNALSIRHSVKVRHVRHF